MQFDSHNLLWAINLLCVICKVQFVPCNYFVQFSVSFFFAIFCAIFFWPFEIDFVQFAFLGAIFLSQEEIFQMNNFSCETNLIFFPVKQYVLPVRGFVPPLEISIHLLCTNSIFPVTRTLFLVRENSFLMKHGLS